MPRILEATLRPLFWNDSWPPLWVSFPPGLWEFIPIILPVFAKDHEAHSSLQLGLLKITPSSFNFWLALSVSTLKTQSERNPHYRVSCWGLVPNSKRPLSNQGWLNYEVAQPHPLLFSSSQCLLSPIL